MTVLFGGIGLVLIPETSAARILQTRAKNLRYSTGDWALHAKADENRINAQTILTVYLVRPFVMFVQEPILALVTAYMSFIYGILYLLFEAVSLLCHLCLLTCADLTIVSHHFPRATRLEPGGRCASVHVLHRWYRDGRRSHCLFNRNQLQEVLREAWKSHSRRTTTSYDRWCYRSSNWLVLVCMVCPDVSTALLAKRHMLTSSTGPQTPTSYGYHRSFQVLCSGWAAW